MRGRSFFLLMLLAAMSGMALALVCLAAAAGGTVSPAVPTAELPPDTELAAPAVPTAAGVEEAAPDGRTLHCARGDVRVTERQCDEHGVSLRRRCYAAAGGDRVEMGRAEAAPAEEPPLVAEWTIPAQEGTVRWYDAAGAAWRSAPLAAGALRASCIVITTDAGEYLLYPPKVYEPLGSGTLRYRPELDGSLELRAAGDGWQVRLTAPALPAGHVADYMAVYSPAGLFEGPEVLDRFWSGYTLDGDAKWCYDGYYFPSPATYTPGGADCLYRLPAAYLCKSFVYGAAQSVRAAALLAVATLDVMAQQQNAAGYFPTLPESQWLSAEYGIGAGFYDTRFNTDLMEIYSKCSDWNRCAEFDETRNRYFDFFLAFAAGHHRETASGGWLVEDYWHPAGGAATHTSLNHQLAETLALYHAARQLDRPELEELADRMLTAVRDTAAQWIRPDQNLHYSVAPDGSYGGSDYPYLTYNDLYALRGALVEQGRAEPALQTLMDAKRTWMDRSGVTEYLK